MADEEEARDQRRRAHWLRMARRLKGATVIAAAEAAGLGPKSGGVVSRWESGERDPSLVQLRRLARFYGVPLAWFTSPEPTDEERLEAAIRAASDAERVDWARVEDLAQEVDGEPAASPRRRTA